MCGFIVLLLLQTTEMSVKVGMKVINNEGVLALMKGSGVFSLKRVGDWVTRYYFATEIENFMFRRGDHKRRVILFRIIYVCIK